MARAQRRCGPVPRAPAHVPAIPRRSARRAARAYWSADRVCVAVRGVLERSGVREARSLALMRLCRAVRWGGGGLVS